MKWWKQRCRADQNHSSPPRKIMPFLRGMAENRVTCSGESSGFLVRVKRTPSMAYVQKAKESSGK